MDACWAIDGELGQAGIMAGTTMSSLVVSGQDCLLAWVGDSGAMRIDMLGKRERWVTQLHTPACPLELDRLRVEWSARDAERDFADSSEFFNKMQANISVGSNTGRRCARAYVESCSMHSSTC